MNEHTPLLQVEHLEMHFPLQEGFLEKVQFNKGRLQLVDEKIHAVNDISFSIQRGETLCLVGESGCGKSTVARIVIRLLKASAGKVFYRGERIDQLAERQLHDYRKRMQMIFQNPYSSLNPRMTIGQTLSEPVRKHFSQLQASEVADKVEKTMGLVGIDPSWSNKYPHEFSGGQRQRVSIARALLTEPECIVADEPISALDVSIQAQVLNLLMEARKQRQLTYLFITHDLSVVRHFGERVIVMYLGRICEIASVSTLFETALHPYSQALLNAIPRFDHHFSSDMLLKGDIPNPIHLPSGCVFHSRCPHASSRCQQEVPQLQLQDNGSQVACHALEEDRI